MSTRWRVEQGDCLEVMRTLEDCSVDAIVTDPPAGISFMGKKWDGDHGGRDQWIARFAEIARECLRVVKPGGHALVWALPRTSHWTATAWEDGGWEVRDRVLHLFGSGFPKSLDVSKALDREAGAEHAVVGFSQGRSGSIHGGGQSVGLPDPVTAPATAAAIQWAGWGTALKPAAEDWWLLRKPLGGRTVAANVREFGTGAINVDGCRVGTEGEVLTMGSGISSTKDGWDRPWKSDPKMRAAREERSRMTEEKANTMGRWPANVVHDGSPEVLAGFPDAGGGFGVRGSCSSEHLKGKKATYETVGYGDSGSAARFFYCAKASRADREAGLDSQRIVVVTCPAWEIEGHKATLRVDTAQSPPRVIAVSGASNNDATVWNTFLFGNATTAPFLTDTKSTISTGTNLTTGLTTCNWFRRLFTSASTPVANGEMGSGGSLAGSAERSTRSITITSEWTVSALGVERATSPTPFTISAPAGSLASHPTVKATELMRWLVRLVTPPHGLVLDPFTGSGSTGRAAVLEGMRFVGIEREAEYVAIAKARIAEAAMQPDLFDHQPMDEENQE